MSKRSFRDLFKRETLEREQSYSSSPVETAVQPFIPGVPFPGFALDARLAEAEKAAVLFVSLTCSSCIDLLPELVAFGTDFDGLLLVVSSGLKEENEELVRYYDYSFPVYTMEENIYKARFELEATPAAIILEKGLMMQQFTIQHIGHLYEQCGVQRG
ncbi:hypothetical protein D3P07_08090 [Paenibacillus sp. 1011MAR3C5]|uniref:hypothetical protein n=1 Tax=Paenibacillus sp. 1011MAR3C5 TaxID=1675787 RepID=UPI000E6B5E97|nr:hypothetical protein [Paenibacillus sp. 1011MAR3C5]RJE90164.1 hypothetical protein D3P07_08090 [Paenibacillus sp. 1011MAR3C5]